MAYMPDTQLDGFNPLKAIGRALGSTGRALVAAIPGVGAAASSVLDTAARMPAKPTAEQSASAAASVAQAAQAATAPVANSTSLVQSTPGQSSNAALLDTVAALIAKQNQPQIQPTYIPVNAQPTQQAAQTPSWLIPAAIGGAGLMLLLAMQRK